ARVRAAAGTTSPIAIATIAVCKRVVMRRLSVGAFALRIRTTLPANQTTFPPATVQFGSFGVRLHFFGGCQLHKWAFTARTSSPKSG
ncbi:MAG: hypothetical protein K2I97_05265, partial [Alistipes sp.]|nr:hypothetical protein [Alistipes sp.]